MNLIIINYKIYELLISLEYNISNQIKNTDLYSIENNKLVLLFQFPSKEITEIGYINNENIFITEFIIYNNENNISTKTLNNFLLNHFSKFKSNKSQSQIQFSYENSNIYCYKLNTMEIYDDQNNNVLDILDYRNLEENEDISANKKIMKYNNYESNELQKKYLELFDKSKKSIKILIFIYLFEKDIEKKIKNSLNPMNGEEYKQFIVEDKGYLINTDWMNNFKNIYLYDKIYDYLNKKSSLEIINNYKNYILEIFMNYKTEFLNNFNNHDLNKNKFNTFPQLSKNELYKNILYYKNFYLINSDNFALLRKKKILNDEYVEVKINYIINNGKIIFKLENNDCNNIYVYKQIDNYAFIPDIIIYFHSNKNEMDEQYAKFKYNKNLEYDKNNIGNKNNFIQVDSFYLVDTQSKVEVSKTESENQLNNKLIEFFFNIDLIHKDIESKTKRSLINANIEKYSIIKKDSINEILNYFEYNKFASFIEEKNKNNIIKSNEKDKSENKFLDEYLKSLNNKEKSLQMFKSNKKINEKKEINYNDDIEIINDKMKNLINELFENIYIEDRKFLFGDQKIIMDYKLNYIIVGNFKNNIFNPEILLYFDQEKHIEYYLSLFKLKGFFENINKLNYDYNVIKISENEEIKVNAYEINNHENNEFHSDLNNNNEESLNIKYKEININNSQSNNLSSSNNLSIINDGKMNDSIKGKSGIESTNKSSENILNINERRDDDPEFQQQLLLGNKNDLNFQNNSQNTVVEAYKYIPCDTNKEEVTDDFKGCSENKEHLNLEKTLFDKEIETSREFNNNNINQKIKLSPFTENQIKALILYYSFYLDLENDVKNSNFKIKNSECYLISKIWMSKFKEFYLYEKLVKNIKSIIQKLNAVINSENIDKIIYDKLDEEYLKEVNEKEDKYSDFFDDKNKISFSTRIIKDEEMREIKIYYGFDILSVNVYNLIVKRKNNSLFDLIKKDYLINDEKIIIKFKEKYRIKLLVGHFDFVNHQYISEVLLYYYNKNNLNNYKGLKNTHYNKLKEEKIINKYLIVGNLQKYYKIGKIIELNNQNNDILKGNEIKMNNEITSTDKAQPTLNIQSKNNIEFLLRLYFYYKFFKERINNPIGNLQNPEIGYIINKDLIEKYKEYYNYNELINFCDLRAMEINSTKELENSLDNLIRNLPNKFIEEIITKDNNSLSRNVALFNTQIINQNLNPDNCVVLYDKLTNILYNNNENIKRNKNKIQIEYFIGDKKLIIIYNNNINVGVIDDNCVFESKQKIHYNTEEELNCILNQIKKKELDNFQNNFNNDFNEPKNTEKPINNDIKIIQIETVNSNYKNRLKIVNDKNTPKGNNGHASPGNINMMIINKIANNLNIDGMNKELKNILSIIIDSEKIKYKMNYKMNIPLNSGNSNEYYLLNYAWFRKYLELNNINDAIYDHLENLVKNNINITNINNQNEMIVNKIMSQINPNIKMEVKKEKENYFKLKSNELFQLNSSSFIIKGNNTLKYYYNFIIISPETMKSLNKDFSFDCYKNKFLILLGENKAFIKRKTQFVIEICFINKNIFIPEMFFYFFNENILNNNLNLLQNDGYEQYSQYNLLFNNDYSSPIFNQNKNIIGYAFKYEPSKKDYSEYIINEQLEALIKIYFSYAQLKNKLNSNECFIGNYFILDKEYVHKIKELFDYNSIEKELNNSTIANQVMNLLEKNNNDSNILNDKSISLIIKQFPEEINKNFNKKEFNNKIECEEIPNLIPFNNDDKLFYYINFEIVDKSIYGLLFGFNGNSSSYEEKDNYLECIFIEKYIFINISKNYKKCILEVCSINDNNKINPLYLLKYGNGKDCLKHIEYVKNLFGIKNFFESLAFTSNNRIEMNDENDQKIGIIYNLGNNKNVNSLSSSINDNQNLSKKLNVDNYNKSDNLFIDNMDKIPRDNNNGSNIINKDKKGFPRQNTSYIISQKIPGFSNNKINTTKKDINKPYNNPQVDNNSLNIKSIKDCFPYPPRIGLQNVGQHVT